MPIRQQKTGLVDDTRTFTAEQITDVWAWLDSLDMEPLSEEARLVRMPLTFRQDRYVFRGRIYSVAKCSDGRELLGSVVGVAPQTANTPGTELIKSETDNT